MPASRSATSAKNRWWLTTTTSASSASLRAFITKQSWKYGHSPPRQFSRVDVTSGQIGAFSGTSAARRGRRAALACAQRSIFAQVRASSRLGEASSRAARSRW